MILPLVGPGGTVVSYRCCYPLPVSCGVFPNTYEEYTKDNPGIQWSLTNVKISSYNFKQLLQHVRQNVSPHPRSPAGDTCLFTSFVYIFGKVLKGTWLRHGRVRPTPFSHPVLTTNIPPTIYYSSPRNNNFI